MNLLHYIVRRLLLGVFVLISVVTITFVLSHSVGGNPIVAWLGKAASRLSPLVAVVTIVKVIE